MPGTVDQSSKTLAPTSTAAATSSSGMFSPSIPSTHYRWSGSIQVRYDNYRAIVVLVRGCYSDYSDHGSCCYLALLGHILSSKAGFVQCFERREQFRRSVFFRGQLQKLPHFRRCPQIKHGPTKKSGTFPFSLPIARSHKNDLRKFVHFCIFVVS